MDAQERRKLRARHLVVEAALDMTKLSSKLRRACMLVLVHGYTNAEAAHKKFAPAPGRITAYREPGGPGVRVDSHAYTNYFVPPNYDSMIGKIITHGDTREQALARMRIALSETLVEGIQTNIPLHRELLVDAKFIEGGTSIHYLEHWLSQRKR